MLIMLGLAIFAFISKAVFNLAAETRSKNPPSELRKEDRRNRPTP